MASRIQSTLNPWNEVAPAYAACATFADSLTDALIADLAPQRGERILDIATGPGQPALDIADRVGPGGHVLGIDASSGMIAIARTRATKRGLVNVVFERMEAESIDAPIASFDAATSQLGFQIMDDPLKAACEIHRLLRPRGRIVIAVPRRGQDNPWSAMATALMQEVAGAPQRGAAFDPTSDDELLRHLETAGFTRLGRRPIQPKARVPTDKLEEFVIHATPLRFVLETLPPRGRSRVLAALHEAAEATLRDGCYHIPLPIALLRGEKP